MPELVVCPSCRETFETVTLPDPDFCSLCGVRLIPVATPEGE